MHSWAGLLLRLNTRTRSTVHTTNENNEPRGKWLSSKKNQLVSDDMREQGATLWQTATKQATLAGFIIGHVSCSRKCLLEIDQQSSYLLEICLICALNCAACQTSSKIIYAYPTHPISVIRVSCTNISVNCNFKFGKLAKQTFKQHLMVKIVNGMTSVI